MTVGQIQALELLPNLFHTDTKNVFNTANHVEDYKPQ